MTRNTIWTLIAVIAGLLLLVLVLDRDGRYEPPSARALLMPDLKGIGSDLTQLTVVRSDEEPDIVLRRDGERWLVPAKDNYPADVSQLRQLLIALTEARMLEEKTSNPDSYAKLGVDDPAAGGSGTRLTFDGDGKSASVILGKVAQGQYRFARLPEQATSYLIDRNPKTPDSPDEWLQADILDIPPDRIRRVSIDHADGEKIVLEKAEEQQSDFTVLDVPDGRELQFPAVGNAVAGALAGLELDDVRKRVDAPAETSVVFETWNGMEISVEVMGEDDASWLTFTATPAEDPAAENEVAGINERLSGWQYRVADYKKNLLTRRWDAFLKPAE